VPPEFIDFAVQFAHLGSQVLEHLADLGDAPLEVAVVAAAHAEFTLELLGVPLHLFAPFVLPGRMQVFGRLDQVVQATLDLTHLRSLVVSLQLPLQLMRFPFEALRFFVMTGFMKLFDLTPHVMKPLFGFADLGLLMGTANLPPNLRELAFEALGFFVMTSLVKLLDLTPHVMKPLFGFADLGLLMGTADLLPNLRELAFDAPGLVVLPGFEQVAEALLQLCGPCFQFVQPVLLVNPLGIFPIRRKRHGIGGRKGRCQHGRHKCSLEHDRTPPMSTDVHVVRLHYRQGRQAFNVLMSIPTALLREATHGPTGGGIERQP
jgi:hypothetical protein